MPVTVIDNSDPISQSAGYTSGRGFADGLFGALRKRSLGATYRPIAEATIRSHPIASSLPPEQQAGLVDSLTSVYSDLAQQGRLGDVGSVFDPFNEGTLRGAQTEAGLALGRERDAGANASNALAGYRLSQMETENAKRPAVVDELRSEAEENRAQGRASDALAGYRGAQANSVNKDLIGRAVLNAARVGDYQSRSRLNDSRAETEVVRRQQLARPSSVKQVTPSQSASIMSNLSDELFGVADELRQSVEADRPGFFGHAGNILWPGRPFSEPSAQTEATLSEALSQANAILPQLGLPPLPENATADEVLSAIDRIRAMLSSKRLGRAMVSGDVEPNSPVVESDVSQMSDEDLLRQLNLR